MAQQLNITTVNILDVGSYDVNGNMKTALLNNPLASLETYYLGIDAEEGPNVDLVVRPSEPWQVAESAYNAIVTSSMFEHDPMFWSTFLKMCKALAPGGLLYVSVPSTGIVHRYPADYWRFYPDAGLALASWARENNYDVYIAFGGIIDSDLNRGYEDNVMIFRKSPVGETNDVREHNLNVLRNMYEGIVTKTLEDKTTLLKGMDSVEETNTLCLHEGAKTQCHTVSNYGKTHEVAD